MIDFRYHLISLIAVFLALGLGILMGSVVLSEKYVTRLENRVDKFGAELDQSRERVSELNDRITALQDFAVEAELRLVDGALAGREIVAFQVAGTDEDLLEGLAEGVEIGGGRIVSTITLTDRFALTDAPERDQLALIVGSSAGTAAELRKDAATELGITAVAAATARVDGARLSPGGQRLRDLVTELQEAEFIGVSTAQENPVPAGAAFLIVGGGSEEPRGGPVQLSLALATSLSARDAAVMVAEPTESAWKLVAAVREDGTAGATVSTVDHAETVPGRIAAVLGLEMAIDGLSGHYGTEDGASAIVPPPTPRA